MKRLYIQHDGNAVLLDNPEPAIEDVGIVVDVTTALISAGTELDLIKSARSMLVRFLKEKRIRNMALAIIKKGNVKEILYYFKRFILKRESTKNFSDPAPPFKSPGYACSGIVRASNVPSVFPGDKVACAGSNHAEMIYS